MATSDKIDMKEAPAEELDTMTEWKTIAREFWRSEDGQDLIEYALLTGMIAVVVAGFLPPALMPYVSTIFSKCSSLMAAS